MNEATGAWGTSEMDKSQLLRESYQTHLADNAAVEIAACSSDNTADQQTDNDGA